jgi:hypothetical protein
MKLRLIAAISAGVALFALSVAPSFAGYYNYGYGYSYSYSYHPHYYGYHYGY